MIETNLRTTTTNHESRMINYESRIVWRIHSIEQRIFINCYESWIMNHESRIVHSSRTLKNASLPHDDRYIQAKADITRPCAFGSRRVEESSKACSSPSARARFLRTHGHLPPLTASHTEHSVRVMARARREPRGCQCFLGVDLKGKNIFDPSAEFSICYMNFLYITSTNSR